jgi:hypothetical protein
MLPSLLALLEEIIDYAGLFPPARLPLDQAIRNYVRYGDGPHAWMLRNFVCPASRLAELTPFQEEIKEAGPFFSITALGRGGNTSREFLAGLRLDLNAITAFLRENGESSADLLEVRLPQDVLGGGGSLAHLLGEIALLLETSGPPTLAVAYEVPFEGDWRKTLGAVLSALTAAQHRQRHGVELKLRCGGPEASSFPTAEQLAWALTACRDAAVPLKFTAGLHHPLRHFDAEVQTQMHGFLNVFGAGVLAHARGLSKEQVQAILEDEDASNFAVDADGFRWKDLRATTPEIVAARQQLVIAFGSCSFEEPCQDLMALGWMR